MATRTAPVLRRMLRVASAVGVSVLLLTGCGDDSGPGSSLPPPGAEGDGSGTGDGEPLDVSYHYMRDWLGCDAFDDLMPVRDYMAAELYSELQNHRINEGLDGEAAGCAGLFHLPAFENPVTGTGTVGEASIRGGLVPWTDEETAAANFQERVDGYRNSDNGLTYDDLGEGELGGTWDESLYMVGEGNPRTYINAWGRYGAWIVYVSLDYYRDAGVHAYELNPDMYPDSSAEEMAAYPFTDEEIIDWVANEYMPQLQASILDRLETAEQEAPLGDS